MLNSDTFGDSLKYKMLPFLVVKINELNTNDRKRISYFIHHFNEIVNSLHSNVHRAYILKILKDDYFKRVDDFKYEIELKSYLKNYINAKINNNE